jgi:alpha-tubulin suppressor-like RCC1 family protein
VPAVPAVRTVSAVQRRAVLFMLGGSTMSVTENDALADSSGPALASYYDRHMALLGGVAHVWLGRGQPQRQRDGVRQVGVSRDACFGLLNDGRLLRWTDDAQRAETLMQGVAAFAAGESGWLAIDAARQLWHGGAHAAQPPHPLHAPRLLASEVVAACVGDSADYFIRSDGTLWVKGLAHRGQYGDGRLSASPDYISTARDALAVKAHTGHALYLRRDGVVLGTGGNRFGPLSSHGLGDKADRWGPVFEGARAIATGSRHSVAIRHDGSLWGWGEGFGIEPRKLREGVLATAAGDTATLALTDDGALWQWDSGGAPRRLRWP